MEKLFYKSQKRLGVSSPSVREGEERVVTRGKDLISLLPDPLLCHILSFLTTEQAVWTSVLSSRWRYLWKWVPRLELNTFDFTNDQVCVDFIDKFLAFQGKYFLREFKLTIDHDVSNNELSLYEPCLSRVDMRKLEGFQVQNEFENGGIFYIRLTISPVCEALVCLKLHCVFLNEFNSLSLPCLKIMFLEDVGFPSDAAAEQLISSSPVLEVLKICLGKYDCVVALRVCSPSLKSFTLRRLEPVDADAVVHSAVIDAPKLEYLSLMDYYHFRSFKITSAAESFKVDIDVKFAPMNDFVLEMIVIYCFLNNFSGAKDMMTISCVKDMTISWKTLQELFINYPLASITKLCTVRLRPSLLSSLESVEIESPVTEEATELKLATGFMKNSPTLKKLVLRLDETTGKKHKPGVLEKLAESRRRSSLCQLEVLPVVPTPNPRSEEDAYVKSNRF